MQSGTPEIGGGLTLGSLPRGGAAPFDGLVGALTAAYGTRRMLSSWSGPLVTLRRDSDGATATFYPEGGGWIAPASLAAWAGAGSAFVTRLWDQTGAGRHAEQPTASSQPRIVNAGVPDTLNGRSALRFDGTDDYLLLQNALGLVRNTGQLTLGMSVNATPVNGATFLRAFTNAAAVWLEFRFTSSSAVGVAGRRLVGDSYQSRSASVTAGTHRLIGRARYADAMADIMIDGVVSSGAFQSAGLTSDVDSASPPLIAQGSGAVYTAMSVTSLVLSRDAVSPAVLDTALAEMLL